MYKQTRNIWYFIIQIQKGMNPQPIYFYKRTSLCAPQGTTSPVGDECQGSRAVVLDGWAAIPSRSKDPFPGATEEHLHI